MCHVSRNISVTWHFETHVSCSVTNLQHSSDAVKDVLDNPLPSAALCSRAGTRLVRAGAWEAVTAVTPIGNYEVELKSWKCILVQLRARQKHRGRDTYCV